MRSIIMYYNSKWDLKQLLSGSKLLAEIILIFKPVLLLITMFHYGYSIYTAVNKEPACLHVFFRTE